jgi:hypothetical protein
MTLNMATTKPKLGGIVPDNKLDAKYRLDSSMVRFVKITGKLPVNLFPDKYTLENCGDNGGIVPVKALYWALNVASLVALNESGIVPLNWLNETSK